MWVNEENLLRKENKIWGFKGQYKNSQETRPGVGVDSTC